MVISIVEEKIPMDKNSVNGNGLTIKVSGFVKELLEKKLPGWALYHSLQHTIDTVNGCMEIGRGSQVTDEEIVILSVAAWFHDTGFTKTVEGHENVSIEIGLSFLNSHDVSEEFKEKISDCILATCLNAKPTNLLEKIICDSDLISLGRQDYYDKNDLLKREIELRDKCEISNYEWTKRSVQFLDSHQYHTDYAKNTFDSGLQKNRITMHNQLKDTDQTV
jgi:predicted metal-dependent HD superfamily phosphohydrolase